MSRSSSSVSRDEGGTREDSCEESRCEWDRATCGSVFAAPSGGAISGPVLAPALSDVEQQLFRLLIAAAPVVKMRIRRRRLGQPLADRSWCTSEAFSSVLRRILAVGRAGSLRALEGAQGHSPAVAVGGRMWAFVESIVGSVVGDFGRRARRDRRLRWKAVEAARSRPRDDGRAATGIASQEVLDALATLDPLDHSIMLLRLRGVAWTGVARAHGMEPAACRKRWSRAVGRLRERVTCG
jgi:hypothetical protein